MGHRITAVILKGDYNVKEAEQYDLFGIKLKDELALFHIDVYYTEFWQEKLNVVGFLDINIVANVLQPNEKVILKLLQLISSNESPEFALIGTDYFGGNGAQAATVFRGEHNVDTSIKTINEALRILGVDKKNAVDEFESVELHHMRRQPEYLSKYSE